MHPGADGGRDAARPTAGRSRRSACPGPCSWRTRGRRSRAPSASRYPGARRVGRACAARATTAATDSWWRAASATGRQRSLLLGARDEVAGRRARPPRGLRARGRPVLEVVADEAAWDAALDASCERADLVVDAVLGTGLRAGADRARRAARSPRCAARRDRRRRRWWPSTSLRACPRTPATSTGRRVRADADRHLRGAEARPRAAAGLRRGGRADRRRHRHPGAASRRRAPSLFLLEDADARRCLPAAAAGAHKGDFGHVLVVAGSRRQDGRGGARRRRRPARGRGPRHGRDARAVPRRSSPPARAEVMTEPLAATTAGRARPGRPGAGCSRSRPSRDAVVLGPGPRAGRRRRARSCGRSCARCPLPLVVDADGLNALARGRREPAGARRAAPRGADRPHAAPGRDGAPRRPHDAARCRRRGRRSPRALARETGAIVVLKGQRTLVAEPGGRAAVNPTGNPGMATGGHRRRAGRARRRAAGAPRRAGSRRPPRVLVHGRAGDLAAARRGEEGMTRGRPGRRAARRRSGRSRAREVRHRAQVTSRSEAETEAVAAGARRAPSAAARSCCSRASWAPGKTAFVRGLARGLGADPEEVASPTFVLLTSYPGRLTLHHADLYRLRGDGDERELGLEELPGPRGRARGRVGRAPRRRALAAAVAGAASSTPAATGGGSRIEEAGVRRASVRRASAVAARGVSRRARGPRREAAEAARQLRAAALPGNGLNVLLITIDTLRADHLGRLRLPPRRRARTSTRSRGRRRVFEQAYTYWPKTRGQLRGDADGPARLADRLRQDATRCCSTSTRRWPACSKDAGYETAAVVDNPNVAALARLRQGLRRATARPGRSRALADRDGPHAGHHRGRGRAT